VLSPGRRRHTDRASTPQTIPSPRHRSRCGRVVIVGLVRVSPVYASRDNRWFNDDAQSDWLLPLAVAAHAARHATSDERVYRRLRHHCV